MKLVESKKKKKILINQMLKEEIEKKDQNQSMLHL
jgi:hypothetical protein